MEAKVVKFKFLKWIIQIWNRYIAYVPHSYRLWSNSFPSSYLFPGVITLACFTFLEWGIRINGIFVVEKGIPCSSFTKKFTPARKHVWEICVGMFITSNKWLKVLDRSPTRDETSWPIFKLTHRTHNINPREIHQPSLSKRKY